jgi:hypothetical protein
MEQKTKDFLKNLHQEHQDDMSAVLDEAKMLNASKLLTNNHS